MSEKLIFTLVFLLFFGNIFYVLFSIKTDDKPEEISIDYQLPPERDSSVKSFPDNKKVETYIEDDIHYDDQAPTENTSEEKKIAGFDINNSRDDSVLLYDNVEKNSQNSDEAEVKSVSFASQEKINYDHNDCSDLESDYNSIKDQAFPAIEKWKRLSSDDSQKSIIGKKLSDLLDEGIEIENKYNECLVLLKKRNDLVKRYIDS